MADRNKELVRLAQDPLRRILRLRHIDNSGSTDIGAVRSALCDSLERFQQSMRAAGKPEHDVEDALYALVALADEEALAGVGTGRTAWLEGLLQRTFFGETTAGEHFFVRLERLRCDPQRRPILLLYYTCLLHGFQGRYRVRGNANELLIVQAGVRRSLGDIVLGTGLLAPDATFDDPPATRMGMRDYLVRFALLAVVLSTLFYGAVRMGLSLVTSEVETQLSTALASLGNP